MRSAVSSTSPSASSRFLPTSIAISAAKLHLPLADQVGRAAQDRDALLPRACAPAGNAARAAAIASLTSCARALGERAQDELSSIGRAVLELALAVALARR